MLRERRKSNPCAPASSEPHRQFESPLSSAVGRGSDAPPLARFAGHPRLRLVLAGCLRRVRTDYQPVEPEEGSSSAETSSGNSRLQAAFALASPDGASASSVSSKDLPVSAWIASFPVNACQRRTATSTYLPAYSMARTFRPVTSAAMIVVPDPEKGSSTRSPRFEQSRIASATSATGL